MRELGSTGAQVQSRERGSADIVNVIQQSYNVSGRSKILEHVMMSFVFLHNKNNALLQILGC